MGPELETGVYPDPMSRTFSKQGCRQMRRALLILAACSNTKSCFAAVQQES
jgi:hypothetical protein